MWQVLQKLERAPGAYYDDRCSDTLVSATGIADVGAGWIDLGIEWCVVVVIDCLSAVALR